MARAHPFRVRTLALPFYLPAALAAIGKGMIMPVIPLFARSFGAGVGVAGAMVGMLPLGAMLANIPAGFLVERIGRRNAMLLGIAAEALFIVLAATTRSIPLLAITLMGAGAAHSVTDIARLSLFRQLVPQSHRGRAIALLGGEFRLGGSVGPVVGGLIASVLGYQAAFMADALVLAVAFLATLLWLPARIGESAGDRSPPGGDGAADAAGTTAPAGGARAAGRAHFPDAATGEPRGHRLRGFAVSVLAGIRRSGRIVRTRWKVFATACLAIFLLSLVRIGRQSIFPLWGEAIGIDVAQIGLIFGIMNAVELALFYPAGMMMDRFGRKATAVPCMTILGAALFFLPFVGSFTGFAVVAIAAGLGNGTGAGINMTLSTDFAPAERPGEFIAIWRTLSDVGSVAGPTIVGVIAASFGLAAAPSVIGTAGLAAALIMLFLVPEPTRRFRSHPAGTQSTLPKR